MVDKISYYQIRFLTLHMHFLIRLEQFLILSLHIFLLQHDFLTWSTQLHRAWHGIPHPTALRYTTPCSSDSHVKHGFFRLINHVKLIWRVVGWCQVYCGTMWSRAPAAQGPSLWLHHDLEQAHPALLARSRVKVHTWLLHRTSCTSCLVTIQQYFLGQIKKIAVQSENHCCLVRNTTGH